MVARALLLRPRVIIADEPVSMVDASLRATILGSLRKLNDEFGISLIYITHDLTTAYQISENIIVLYRGTVAEAGDVEQVVASRSIPIRSSWSARSRCRIPTTHGGRSSAEAWRNFAGSTRDAVCRTLSRGDGDVP